MSIPPETVQRLLGEARSATLGTVDEKGQVHLVPIVFAFQDGMIYTAVDAKPKTTHRLKRIRNIESNPRVSVLVDHYHDDWERLWWIRLDGKARIVESGPARTSALLLLAEKYPIYVDQPPPGPAIVIEVETIRSWRPI
ncbi:MAG: TIGR03668 family PPOX class F420-dependent oxidoreductase [bacterium]|nr:TIGR03668 family PPOX class F420-dependent oxidoreductase [bacterium]MDE0643255.1 TIGR03668 family PPOX class F420-dependent oxidoreductase [bacterium]MYD03717.1 TIGR03668 family PPOX class F420-dependent oxidoreductase [Acidimicrobiia bacterium]